MRIVLIGATGLIGGKVWERLRANHEVVRLGRRAVCELRADLTVSSSFAKLDLFGYDALIHCAGVVDEDFKNSPQNAWSQAVIGAQAICDRALRDGIKRLVYFSTTHVYGVFHGKLTEESCPNPLSPYAIAHYATEQVLKSYACNDLKIFILRPNAVYGIPVDWDAFDRWSLVPFELPLQAVYRGKIVLKTSGVQKRNFVSTQDLARYVEQLLMLTGGENPLFLNALGTDTMSIYDFAHMCADVYKDKKGITCAVECPKLPLTAEDFGVSTNKPSFQPSERVEDFVSEFTTAVIERSIKGKTYGEYGF